jgi:CHAD domain-containing protein
VTSFREIERKFDADPTAPFPDLSGVSDAVSEPAELHLEATYFDTADARLLRRGITLRRRIGGDDAGWHLKLPVGQDERTEVRLPLGRGAKAVPDAMVREVRAVVRDRPLVPIAVLRTTRVERTLMDANGNVLATVADDTVHAERSTGGALELSTWREVEVELVNGDRAFLDGVSDRLRAAGLTPSASGSKLARVFGDFAIPKRASKSDALDRRATSGAVLLAHLQRQVDQLVTRDREARSDKADGVHQMRVATRRLRSALATYRPLLDRQATDPLRGELRWLGGMLGRARDTEVLHRRLRDSLAAQPNELVQGPVGPRIDQELQNRHQAAHAELGAALETKRYFRLLDALDQLVADPPLTARAGKPARKQLPTLVGRAARRIDRAAQAVAKAPTRHAHDHLLHEVRKSAKRARYAAESAIPAVGKPAKRLASRMKALQDVLGEHQDSVAARALLLELAAAAYLAGENTFTYGLLHAQERARAIEAHRGYEPALTKASAKKTRSWTR